VTASFIQNGAALYNKATHKCITIPNGNQTDGNVLKLAICNGAPISQGFLLNSASTLSSGASGIVFQSSDGISYITAAVSQGGNFVQIAEANSTQLSSQIWTTTNGAGGAFYIQNTNLGACLQGNGTTLQFTSCNITDPTQLFSQYVLSSFAGNNGLGGGSTSAAQVGDSYYDFFSSNVNLINKHNQRTDQQKSPCSSGSTGSKSPTFKMTVNKFSTMSQAHFFRTRTGRTSESRGNRTLGQYKREMADSELPSSLDFRGTRMDGPGVKDQAWCQCCWAFSVAGALQGAWNKQTGDWLSFSEQQLIDCSWEYGTSACNEGDPWGALQYVVDNGIALEG
ncbi:hypothetical protein Vretimale_7324, partial [Volvox reticuliferus]